MTRCRCRANKLSSAQEADDIDERGRKPKYEDCPYDSVEAAVQEPMSSQPLMANAHGPETGELGARISGSILIGPLRSSMSAHSNLAPEVLSELLY